MTYRYGRGKKWTTSRIAWIDADSLQWFTYTKDNELLGYGEYDKSPPCNFWSTDLTIMEPPSRMGRRPYRRIRHFRSLKAAMRFVRKCPFIKKGQKVWLVSGYVGYASIEITK